MSRIQGLFRAAALPVVIAGGMFAFGSAASAAIITDGLYQLHNHPDGNEVPPPYGMRLDELFNVTGGNDVFTFDFDHAASNMQMTVSGGGTVINIFGQTYGGRDTGAGYAADAHLGLYFVNFTYNIGVGLAGGDDDLIVQAPDASNSGSITTPSGPVFSLADVNGNAPPYSFRLGDEDDDLGHRGFAGISGWGWVDVGGLAHGPTRDFIFTAELIPAPGAALSMGLFGLIAAGRRRR